MVNHITIATYSSAGMTKTSPVWQYDYGQELQLVGFGDMLPKNFEAHFSGVLKDGSAVTQIGTDGVVRIPDGCLKQGGFVTCWLFLHDAETDGETRYLIEIPVKGRAAISNVTPTPDEISTISQVINALNAGVEKAEAAQEAAEDVVESLERKMAPRVESLDETELATGAVIETVGAPVYVEDVSQYAGYGITEKGWYIFAKITAPDGKKVTAGTTVTGADGYNATKGDDHVAVAVRFGVAAESKAVRVAWDADTVETFVFKATDLAVRNLDYRATFYVYDIADYVSWEFARTTDTTFGEGKKYYLPDGEGGYAEAEVAAGGAVPAYYEKSESYALTADTTFQEGKTYYTKSGDVYTEAAVTVGEAVAADTYYEKTVSYALTEDAAFVSGKTYYTLSEGTYTEAAVTAGDPIVVYYKHSKVIFEGMARNISYRLDEIIDCAVEIRVPEIEEDGYGAWYEIQTRMDGAYSVTLTLPEGVTAGTTTTQAFAAGIDTIDLHYVAVGGAKTWQLINTATKLS